MATRSQVPTPGWRRLTQSDLLSKLEQSANPATLSESDDDEAFIAKHNDIANEERERWAGVSAQKSMKKVYAATKGSTSKSAASKRARANLPKQEALYPKPMESFLLVEEAKKAYFEKFGNNAQSGDKHEVLRRNLKHFIQPIKSFAAIENLMKKEMEKIEQLHTSRMLPSPVESRSQSQSPEPCSSEQTSKTQFSFDDGTKFELDSLAPVKRRKRTSTNNNNFFFTSGHQMPDALSRDEPEKKALDVAMMELAMERMGTFKEIFNDRTVAMYNAAEDILKQADWKLPKEKSFVQMNQCFEEALKSGTEAGKKSNQGKNQLAECIKLKIDPKRYPVVAKTFNLGEDYCLDGCDMDQSWIAKMRKAKQDKNNSRRTAPSRNSDDHHVSSHGFSLPMYAFDSDEEMDVEIGNPLLEDVWGDVRKRLARKRSRKRKIDQDDFFAGIESPDIDVSLSVETMPKTLRKGGKLELVHPDDEHFEKATISKLPNDLADETCKISMEIPLDEDDELEELDFPPPTMLVAAQSSNPQPTGNVSNQPNGTANLDNNANANPDVQDIGVAPDVQVIGVAPDVQPVNNQPFVKEFDITPSSQEEVGAGSGDEPKEPNVANLSQARGMDTEEQLYESQSTGNNTPVQANTVKEHANGDRGMVAADIT